MDSRFRHWKPKLITFENIVDNIYRAASEPDIWPAVLHDIGASVQAPVMALLAVRGDLPVGWCLSRDTPASAHDYMRSDARQRSLTTPRLLSANHAGFLSALDVLTEEELKADPLITEWGAHEGLHHAAASAIQIPTGDLIVVHVQRRSGKPAFQKGDIARLDEFRPHLARAGLLAARWRLERLRAATEALALLGLPAAALDLSGRVLAANRLTQDTPNWVTWLPGDRIALRDSAADALLDRAVAELRNPCSSSVRSIPIRANIAGAAVLHLIPISGRSSELFDGAFGLVVITPICTPAIPTSAMLHALFDLTPAEARVSRGISEGLQLSQIATRYGVTVETIRAQIKAIFAKTGTCRQSELTALLASLPKQPPGEPN
jgi:DNA-binding CsgD family transcriptional regulator